jgi:hypothetical protein
MDKGKAKITYVAVGKVIRAFLLASRAAVRLQAEARRELWKRVLVSGIAGQNGLLLRSSAARRTTIDCPFTDPQSIVFARVFGRLPLAGQVRFLR